MDYQVKWTHAALQQYQELKQGAEASYQARQNKSRTKAAPAEGLFKQVHSALQKLTTNPRHPGLHTHKFQSLEHPFHPGDPVFEAYAQNQTPGAYRIFWCYGPDSSQITIIAITPHP